MTYLFSIDLLTHKFDLNKVEGARVLEENAVLLRGLELESDISRGRPLKRWETNSGVRLAEGHNVIKQVCNIRMRMLIYEEYPC